jgi:hypothetical protein
LFGDRITYNPQDPYLAGLASAQYDYDYSNHRSALADIINFFGKRFEDETRVEVTKSNKTGEIYLIPTMEVGVWPVQYSLKYPYVQKGYTPSLLIPDENCALKLEFQDIGGLLSFLNATLFSQGFDLGLTQQERHDALRNEFRKKILDRLEYNINGGVFASQLYDALKTLYYLPDNVAKEINRNVTWLLFRKLLDGAGFSNNANIAAENIFVKLIGLLIEQGQQKRLLDFLATPTDDKETLWLERLYNEIDGDNNLALVNLINKAWKNTDYIYPDTRVNKAYSSSNGPLMLPYESEKWLGLYSSNASISWHTNEDKQRLIRVIYKTGETKSSFVPTVGTVITELTETVYYHPYHPIFLKNLEKKDTELQLDAIVPAFLLLANEKKQFWSNVITAGEYALDVLTTLSGIGNIAKFRYLAKFAARAGRLRFVGAAGQAVANTRKVVAAVAAVVEITSGTVNILLKMANNNTSLIGSKISAYLFWLELLSLSGELSVTLHNGLRKSAKEVLEHEDDLLLEAKKIGSQNIDDVLEEIRVIADEKVRSLNIGDDIIGEIDAGTISRMAAKVRKVTKLQNFDIYIVDRNNETFSNLFKEWQKAPRVEGVFIPKTGMYNRYRAHLPGPKIYLFTGNTVEGLIIIKKHTLQHEIFHAEMHGRLIEKFGYEKYKQIIDKIPTHIKEEYVVHRFLTSKSKAMNTKEIKNEIQLINDKYRKESGLNSFVDKDLLEKDWNFWNELKKIKIY